MTIKSLTPQAARRQIHSAEEVAFLDVREAGQFGEGHPLFAVPAPYSRLELMIGGLVPQLATPIILIDDNETLARLAGRRLENIGYQKISVILGGIENWSIAGFQIYKGVNVASKTLGELAEHIWHPKMIRPDRLGAWLAAGNVHNLFDARPPQEFTKITVPGARCIPNGELVHRLPALSLDADQPLVITCAGRTRGITGVIGLMAAGYEGEILALENGTQGWALAGLELSRGNDAGEFPEMAEAALARSKTLADGFIEKYQIPIANGRDIEEFLADTSRTTYVFDCRSAVEVSNDPVAVATHAPGGQLVQASDQWIGVRNARVIMCCDTGMRSALAAFWLRQLGYEVLIAYIDNALRGLQRRQIAAVCETETALFISAHEALDQQKTGSTIVDLRGSMAFREEHVVGAVWSIRPNLTALAGALKIEKFMLVVDSEEVAHLAISDLREAGLTDVKIIKNGHPALVAAGAALERSPDFPVDRDAIDHLFFVHDRHDGNLASARRYLQWETGLIDQLDALERSQFKLQQPL